MKLPLRILTVGLAATAVTVGAVRIVQDYRSGQGFNPIASDREMQNNQVLFPDSDSTSGTRDQDSSDENSFWERENAENETSYEGTNAGYLFGQDQLPDGITTGGLAQDGSDNNGVTGDNIYDIVDGGSGGDIILPDNGNGKPKPNPTEPTPGYGSSSKDELNSNHVPPALPAATAMSTLGARRRIFLKNSIITKCAFPRRTRQIFMRGKPCIAAKPV